LEWLHRLAHEPRRLARRYLVEGLPFASRLLSQSLVAGITGSARVEANSRPPATPGQPAKPVAPPTPIPRKQLVSLVHQSFADGFMSQMRTPRNSFQTRTSTMFHSRRDHQIKAFVLLGGSLRPTPFRAAVSRSILDLPIERNKRLLRHWQLQALELARAEQIEQLLIRVLVDRDSYLPASAPTDGNCAVSIERDPAQFRGTGGVLRDLAEQYDDDDLLLVANGAQLLTLPLPEMVDQLYQAEADVSFVAHQDGTPSGLMLIRCAALRMISSSGYVDMKEQALPAIARRFRVTHIDYRRPSGLLLRSYQDYLAAIRWRHHARLIEAMGNADLLDPFLPEPDRLDSSRAGRGHRLPGFSIVEDGAIVDPSACLHDCVVLRGARVGFNSVVARSVLCAGSVLGNNESAVDQLLSSAKPTATPSHRVFQPA
jgi:hypothetical protein